MADVGEQFAGQDLRCTKTQDHGLAKALDNELIRIAAPALERGEPVRAQLAVRNVNRTVGTMLGHEVTKRYAGEGLPDGTIDLTMIGSAGQSFGAFLPRGITLRLEGDANDYVGKGLSGGRIVIRPDRSATFAAQRADHRRATSSATARRRARSSSAGGVGERFCVRNSGATAVVEGVGDHGCEYMTGGRVLVLGKTGRNFAAGMCGGTAYVLDLEAPPGQPRARRPRPRAGRRRRRSSSTLVTRHHEETGSPVAEELLADWPAAVARFTEVMPRDYRRVLEARGRRRGATVSTRTRPTAGSWRCCMADPRGLPEDDRAVAERRPVDERVHDWNEVYPGGPGRALLPIITTQAGRAAWTAASRSATRAARWAT